MSVVASLLRAVVTPRNSKKLATLRNLENFSPFLGAIAPSEATAATVHTYFTHKYHTFGVWWEPSAPFCEDKSSLMY